MKIDRLLAITIFLLNRRRVTARDLAERFEVSIRTIQRDMDSLALAGIPVYTERGRDGGYRLVDGYTVDRQMFSAAELEGLSGLVERLGRVLDHPQLRTTGEKLRQLGRERPPSRHQPLIMDFTPWGMDGRIRRNFRLAAQGVEERRILLFHYTSADGRTGRRRVAPLSLLIRGNAWYLYGFCRLRQAIRLFKITRLRDMEIEDERFDPDQYPPFHEQSISAGDRRRTTMFVLRIQAEARGRISDYSGSDNLLEMPDGTFLGIFPFPEDDWVYSWILSFGPLAEIVHPAHARDRTARMAMDLARVYHGNGDNEAE